MKLSIVIPAFNEEPTLNILLQKVIQTSLPSHVIKEIIVVNDGSSDGTEKILDGYSNQTNFKIFHNPRNLGKTYSIKSGMEKATGDFILIQDADLEYDPELYPNLLQPIFENKTSVVYGSRFKGVIKDMALVNRIANVLSNLTFNVLYWSRLSDINTCFKIFPREAMKDVTITSKNFMFETEITAKLIRKGYKILEVPIPYVARSKKEGKKISWLKAVQMYWGIFYYRFLN